jgi:translation initiation factor IF-2
MLPRRSRLGGRDGGRLEKALRGRGLTATPALAEAAARPDPPSRACPGTSARPPRGGPGSGAGTGGALRRRFAGGDLAATPALAEAASPPEPPSRACPGTSARPPRGGPGSGAGTGGALRRRFAGGDLAATPALAEAAARPEPPSRACPGTSAQTPAEVPARGPGRGAPGQGAGTGGGLRGGWPSLATGAREATGAGHPPGPRGPVPLSSRTTQPRGSRPSPPRSGRSRRALQA